MDRPEDAFGYLMDYKYDVYFEKYDYNGDKSMSKPEMFNLIIDMFGADTEKVNILRI